MNKPWDRIVKPTFVVSKERAIKNIQQLAQKCKDSNVVFRPHFKTHQSTVVGEWFKQCGVDKICVSSIEMAEKFVNSAWKDVSIVFPFNRRELKVLSGMANENTINILVEDAETVDFLNTNINYKLGVFIKIDVGYKRAGLDSKDINTIEAIALKIQQSNTMTFEGLLSHFGNNYNLIGAEAIIDEYEKNVGMLEVLRNQLRANYPDIIISIGDTPTASLVPHFWGVDEMRPGNFVYYDWMQYLIGSCKLDQIASIMLCPVVAKHAERNELIIHGGAVHFSKEKLEHFGAICDISEGFSTRAIQGVFLKSISQEHGIIKCTDSFFNDTNIGDLIGVIPIHSCLTANLMVDSTVII